MSTQTLEIDDLLLARAKRGEQVALSRLYGHYEALIFKLCVRLLGERHAALDAMQDAFLKAFSALAEFRADTPFVHWLKRIAINRCLHEIRGRKHQEPLMEESALVDLAQKLDAEVDLQRALDLLPVRTRSVVWLYFVEGYTHQEIAQLFGQSLSFSKSQVQRASDKMRASLLGDMP
jgi:RNA polymerase sigma factor (sigma-70 family)